MLWLLLLRLLVPLLLLRLLNDMLRIIRQASRRVWRGNILLLLVMLQSTEREYVFILVRQGRYHSSMSPTERPWGGV